jgi:transglutaminase-like putative cysteine protease
MSRIRLAPPQGWLTLALLVIMAVVVGWAIDEPNWVIGSETLTDFLPWAAVGGVLTGFITAELGWRRLRAHFAGAVVAALVVPVIVGSVLMPEEGNFARLFQAAADSSADAVRELVIQGRGSTQQYGHFLLVLGLLLWATGQFSGYAVFGHRRPMPAVIALGTALLVNMALAPIDQLWLLVVFSLASLLLLVRLHAIDERAEWVRRHIGDPGPLASLTARSGAVFVSVAVIGALALTATAKSEPLSGAWTGAEDWVVDVGRGLSRYFTFLNNPRGPAIVDFGPSADIGTKWTNDGRVALRVTVPIGDTEAYYWRATTYDLFTGSGWLTTDETQERRPAGADLFEGTLERSLAPLADPTDGGGRNVVVTIEPDGYRGVQMLVPGTALTASTDTFVNLAGEAGFVSSIEARERGRPYTVTAQVPTTGDSDPLALTANKLRAAGTGYPFQIVSRYLPSNPAGVVGPEAERILALAEENARADAAERGEAPTPYDLVVAMVDLMHDTTQFDYQSDISDLDCGGRGVVECFAYLRQGFCQYYASAAAVLLREAGIPTRFVQGFLPGQRSPDGTEIVRNSGAHAWIEVYFPGFGWVMFDPTGGGLAASAPVLPPGAPVVRPSPTPPRSPGPDERDPTRPRPSVGPGGGAAGGGPGDPGTAPFVLVGLVLAAGVGWLAFAAYRRGPRDVTPDGAWRSVTGTARRLGFGPRPTQTVFEYSTALGDVLPSVRPEIETVALAKVEVAYGRATLGPDRLRAIRAATGRLRVGLLRLVLRRVGLPRR